MFFTVALDWCVLQMILDWRQIIYHITIITIAGHETGHIEFGSVYQC